ncbi:hypothetical protein E8L90_06645 [Brevibacillus antibioticus]|uniref:DUF4367 domain-containing protein n=1 Tax=Brevibacillus antibioticus TaxID=2570228 RepID=A0A4U2Y3T8_9BACL|nr:hypothetical protein [Brevibacillus antibioticus]TKI55150.1 hypothetical protein E8L90_06645 [Brevibacillus antibioticus]
MTDQQKTEIWEAAEKTGVEKVYIPSFVRKGQKLMKVVVSTGDVFYFRLVFSGEGEGYYLQITESPEEVLLDGVIIEEKETKIKDIPAKWISFSNSRDNVEAASAGLYFKMESTFIRIAESEFKKPFKITQSVEEMAASLQPLTK